MKLSQSTNKIKSTVNDVPKQKTEDLGGFTCEFHQSFEVMTSTQYKLIQKMEMKQFLT